MEGLKMKYFVLKPDGNGVEDKYAWALRKAIMAYSFAIDPWNSKLADNLRKWIRQIEKELK